MEIEYYCDNQRHLVCVPYSVENLHRMAEDLDIKRCWFHNKKGHPHYDIPKRRIEEITLKCKLISSKEILSIIEDTKMSDTDLSVLKVNLTESENFIKIDEKKFEFFISYLERKERYEDAIHLVDYKNKIILSSDK